MDGGNLRSDTMDVIATFVNPSSEPYFENHNWTTKFTENATGFEEFKIIPESIDPKNIGIEEGEEKFEVFYFIDGKKKISSQNV